MLLPYMQVMIITITINIVMITQMCSKRRQTESETGQELVDKLPYAMIKEQRSLN